MSFFYESKVIPLSGIAVCCRQTGTTCISNHTGFIPTSWRHYVETDSLAAYFLREDWASEMPALKSRPDIIDNIINNNPRASILEGFGTVIFKDRNNSSLDSSNVLICIRLAPGQDCKEFLDQF